MTSGSTFSGSNGVFPGATNVQPNGYNSVLTNSASVRDLYQRIGVSADATIYANFAGRHAFKTGVQFERIRNDVFSAEQQPHITFNWNASRPTLDGRNVRGPYGYYSWRQFGTIGDVHVNNLGFFFQDDWSVSDRLTLNLGIRTEKEDVPSYVEGLEGIKFSFGDKFAPRAGFAYDIKGDGKWKAYGSYGMFYDIMKLELPRGAFGGDKWIEQVLHARHPRLPLDRSERQLPRHLHRVGQLPHPVERSVVPGMRRHRPGPEADAPAGVRRRLRSRARAARVDRRPLRPQAARSRRRGRRRARARHRRGLLHRQPG